MNYNRYFDNFKDHEIIRANFQEGRWLLARRYENGSIHSDYLTEIISLHGGRLFVGGDIGDCTFAYYSGPKDERQKDNHMAKIRWIARASESYLQEKAMIGISNKSIVTQWTIASAIEDIKWYLDNFHLEEYKEVLESLQCGLIDHQYELQQALSNLDDDEPPYEAGERISTRVLVAQAACQKLASLFRV